MIGKEIADLWPLLVVLVAGGLAAWGWRRHIKGQRRIGRLEVVEDAAKKEDEAAEVLVGPLPDSAADEWDKLRDNRSKT